MSCSEGRVCAHELKSSNYPVRTSQDSYFLTTVRRCGGAAYVLVEAEGGGVRGADRSLSLPLCSLEGNKD